MVCVVIVSDLVSALVSEQGLVHQHNRVPTHVRVSREGQDHILQHLIETDTRIQ